MLNCTIQVNVVLFLVCTLHVRYPCTVLCYPVACPSSSLARWPALTLHEDGGHRHWSEVLGTCALLRVCFVFLWFALEFDTHIKTEQQRWADTHTRRLLQAGGRASHSLWHNAVFQLHCRGGNASFIQEHGCEFSRLCGDRFCVWVIGEEQRNLHSSIYSICVCVCVCMYRQDVDASGEWWTNALYTWHPAQKPSGSIQYFDKR